VKDVLHLSFVPDVDSDIVNLTEDIFYHKHWEYINDICLYPVLS